MASSGEEGLRARAREPFVVVVPLSRSLSLFSVRSTHDAFERRSVAFETFAERGGRSRALLVFLGNEAPHRALVQDLVNTQRR